VLGVQYPLAKNVRVLLKTNVRCPQPPRCERRSSVAVFVDEEAEVKGLRQNDTAYEILLALRYFSRFTPCPPSIKGPVAIVGLGDQQIKIAIDAIALLTRPCKCLLPC
jgi:hypothetical protein